MSTNIDFNALPDVSVLEQLANHYFKGDSQPIVPEAAEPMNNGDANKYHSTAIPVATFGGVQTLRPSVGGLGVSPSAQQPYFPNNEEGNNAVHYQSANGGRIPASVAGSGATPSTSVQHGNNTDIKNPQTGFPDSNLKESSNQSVPGDSVFAPTHFLKTYLPFEAESYDDFHLALNGIIGFGSASQLPVNPPTSFGNSDTSEYYFLEGIQPSFEPQLPVNPPHLKSVSPFDLKGSATNFVGFDANLVKKDFPILKEQVNGKPIVWLDNAATTQKPQQVIDRISYFYQHENSNIHRAAHELAARATDAYEDARKKVQQFIGAASVNEIVFVRGTTEAINLVAKSWGEQYLQAGDEIIVSHLEHHANIVPWQQLAAKKSLKLKVIPVDDDGQIILEEYAKLLTSKTKLVSFTQVSNALGTITPASAIIELAHQAGAKVLLDGAQSVSHIRTNVVALNADWFVFSGHKVFGPTGIGVLYGKEQILNATEPWQGGGNMIKDVTFEYTQYHQAPSRFEAGTGNIADAVGLGAALDYVNKLGIDNIFTYEHLLLEYATHQLKTVPGIRLVGTAKEKTSVLSFTLKGYTNDQVGQALNQEGIAVRTGHHCAQPILRRFGLESTVRPSLAFYNTCSDIDRLVATLHHLKRN